MPASPCLPINLPAVKDKEKDRKKEKERTVKEPTVPAYLAYLAYLLMEPLLSLRKVKDRRGEGK